MDWLFKIRKRKIYIFGIKICCNVPLFFEGYDNINEDYDSSDMSYMSDHDSDEP